MHGGCRKVYISMLLLFIYSFFQTGTHTEKACESIRLSVFTCLWWRGEGAEHRAPNSFKKGEKKNPAAARMTTRTAWSP